MAIRRACSPRIVQKIPSAASSSTSAPRSPSASASRSSSARLISSAASASIVANWSRLNRPSRWRPAYAIAQRPPGGARLVALAGLLELQAAELADGLEHPVADAARRLADAQQRLVDEPLDRVERAVAEHRVGRLEREPVVEQREPAQRAPLGLVEQVPRPVDHGEQRLVAVGRAAVAAAQQREAVLEAPVDLLDRHRADLRRGELDRQRQAVEPGHDARARAPRAARRRGRAASARSRNSAAASAGSSSPSR